MRAAILNEVNAPLDLTDRFNVDSPQGHEVLVRTAASGVCHSDLHFVEGKWTTFSLPLVLGHECSGVVDAVGDQVSYLKPGDHVVGCLTAFCGECNYCMSGRTYLCASTDLRRGPDDPSRLTVDGHPVSQFVNLSSFAEMMLVHERALVKIDPSVPLDVAAILGCAVTTGLGAVFNSAAVRPGETVAIFGCGGVGLNAVQGARIAGAGRIIAVDLSPAKLDVARSFGATDLVNAGSVDAVEAVLEMTHGGVDHAIECVGLKATVEQAFRVLKAGAVATVVGMVPEGTMIEVNGVDLLFERRLQGSNMGSNRFRIDIPRYIDLYRDGRLELDRLITARIDLADVDAALTSLKNSEGVMRSVVVFE